MSAAAPGQRKDTSLAEPSLDILDCDCSGELKTARTQNIMKLFLLLYCCYF